MRKPMLAVAAAMTLAAAAAQARDGDAANNGARYVEDALAWRIGDRPPASRWRAIREHRRFMLPDPGPGGVMAALDDVIVELDDTGAIVRFHSL